MSVEGWMQYLQVLQNQIIWWQQSQSSNTASTFEPPYRTSEKSHSMRTITKEINFIVDKKGKLISSGHITSFLKVGEGVGVERTRPKKFDKHEKVVRTGLWSLWIINKIRSKLTKEKQFYSYYLIFVSICFTYKALPKKIGGGEGVLHDNTFFLNL